MRLAPAPAPALVLACLACLACLAGPASAQSVDISGYPLGPHPADDYVTAVEAFNAGERLEGVCLFYRGQFRFRTHLSARPAAVAAGEGALMGSLNESVGRPLNEWAGGDRDDWLAVLDCGLGWAAAADDPFTPRAAFPAAWAEQRAGFQALRDQIASTSRAEIRSKRAAAGLPNR